MKETPRTEGKRRQKLHLNNTETRLTLQRVLTACDLQRIVETLELYEVF